MTSYRNLWDIAVLPLLREAPMHPYQMQRLLKERHKDELLGITALGRRELIQTLQQMIEIPRHESSEFMAALSSFCNSSTRTRSKSWRNERNASTNRLKEAQKKVDRINLIESEYLLAMRRAELKWVRSIIPELRSGDLRWNIKKNIPERKRKQKGGCYSGGEMTMGPVINQTAPIRSSKSRSLRAALALVVLAPLIGEVLSGATGISFIFVFVPEIMVWGCGTLIIRELVRRWNGGWSSILLLGLGPVDRRGVRHPRDLSRPASLARHRCKLWLSRWSQLDIFPLLLGYKCVWITLVLIQLAELIFADRRSERWLSDRGLIISAVVFVRAPSSRGPPGSRDQVRSSFTPPTTPSIGNHPRGSAGNSTSRADGIQNQQNRAHAGCFTYAPISLSHHAGGYGNVPAVVSADLPDLRLEITVALLDSDYHRPPMGGADVSGHSILDILTSMAGHPSMGARLRCHIDLHDCRLLRQQPLATDRSDRHSHPQCARRRRSCSPRCKDQTASSVSIARARTQLNMNRAFRFGR